MAAANEKRVTSNDPLTILSELVMNGADLATIQNMQSFIEKVEASKAREKFNAAFAKAKKKFKQAAKSGYNNHIGSHYSMLCDYDEATREALSNYGFAWNHVTQQTQDRLRVTCILMHESGYSRETSLEANQHEVMNKAINSIQSLGSVSEYLRRLTLKASLGITSKEPEDDDGEGLGMKGETPQKKEKVPPKKQTPDNPIEKGQARLIRGKLKNKNIDESVFCEKMGVTKVEEILKKDINAVMEWIDSHNA